VALPLLGGEGHTIFFGCEALSYKLKAINRCLAAIGESPVNSLSSGLPDAGKASTFIDEVTLDVLSAGWHSNSSYNIELNPDNDGFIKVASNVIRIDSSGVSAWINVAVRRDPSDQILKLYNIEEATYVFEDSVWVDIVYSFEIDDLPYSLQNYISARSARVFQSRVLSSVSLDSFTTREEGEAWAKLVDHEAEVEDSNALLDSPYIRAVIGRNNRLYGR